MTTMSWGEHGAMVRGTIPTRHPQRDSVDTIITVTDPADRVSWAVQLVLGGAIQADTTTTSTTLIPASCSSRSPAASPTRLRLFNGHESGFRTVPLDADRCASVLWEPT